MQIGFQDLVRPVNFDKKRSRLEQKYESSHSRSPSNEKVAIVHSPTIAENNQSSKEYSVERPAKRVTLLKKGVVNTSGDKSASKWEVDKKLREQVYVNQVSFPQT